MWALSFYNLFSVGSCSGVVSVPTVAGNELQNQDTLLMTVGESSMAFLCHYVMSMRYPWIPAPLVISSVYLQLQNG